jgi:UDP-N-acetylglucosamine--N-acetylmuramyl-(pentapeptide) pyrophosphoryl-undecaprenol N-acetylglucosamine transferase
MTDKTIVLSSGGTGGHMFPADALARDLTSRGYRVVLFTDIRGKRFEPFGEGVPVHVIKSATLGGGIMGKVKSVAALGIGFFQARKLLKELKPAVVVGFGGYPSFPGVYAAQKMGIKTIIHEQNAILGKANVMLADGAERIALSWENSSGMSNDERKRSIVTGNPVRPDIAALYTQPYPVLEADGKLRIFVMGGSLGATIFSDVLPKAFAQLPPEYKKRLEVVQQCRAEDIEEVRAAYREAGIDADTQPFFNDVAAQYKKAHLFIGRSGASTVAEVATAGRPAIFVPYPHHADQQQTRNAETIADMGGAWVMNQSGFTPEALNARIQTFLQTPQILFRAAEAARHSGRPDAARKLGNVVMMMASGWSEEKIDAAE